MIHTASPERSAAALERAPARRLVLGAASVLTACALVGVALSPYLAAEHPLLLVGLNPDGRHLLLCVGRVEPWQAVLVGSIRRALSFFATFAVASVYSQPLMEWMGKRHVVIRRFARFVERTYERFGVWLVLLAPSYAVAGVSGTAQMPWRKFALAMLPGQVVYVVVMLWIGTALERWTTPVVAFVTEHAIGLTGLAFALVVSQVVWSRHRKRGLGPIPAIEVGDRHDGAHRRHRIRCCA